jgi:hypothetical protein
MPLPRQHATPAANIRHCPSQSRIINSYCIGVSPPLPIATAAATVHGYRDATHRNCMAPPSRLPRLVVASPFDAATTVHCNRAAILLSIALLPLSPIAIAQPSLTFVASMSYLHRPSPPPPPPFMAIVTPHIMVMPPSPHPLSRRQRCLLQSYHCHRRLSLHCHLSITAHHHHDCAAVLPSFAQPLPAPIAIAPPSPFSSPCHLATIAHRRRHHSMGL